MSAIWKGHSSSTAALTGYGECRPSSSSMATSVSCGRNLLRTVESEMNGDKEPSSSLTEISRLQNVSPKSKPHNRDCRDVLTRHCFLYEVCIFKQMVIHGDFSLGGHLPGFFVGDLKIEGERIICSATSTMTTGFAHPRTSGRNIFLAICRFFEWPLASFVFTPRRKRPTINKRIVPTREARIWFADN